MNLIVLSLVAVFFLVLVCANWKMHAQMYFCSSIGLEMQFWLGNFLFLYFVHTEQCEYVNGNQKDDSGPGTLLLLFSTPNTQQHTPSTFVHRTGTSSYRIETAYEVRVRTQAICVNDNEAVASNGQPVWTTKEAGACVLSALLLKLTPETAGTSKITT